MQITMIHENRSRKRGGASAGERAKEAGPVADSHDPWKPVRREGTKTPGKK